MPGPAVSTMTTQRIDRLLRSLVGVADVRILWRARSLRAVHILRADGTQPHQLIRNIVSGLQAGFGLQVLPTQVHIHDDELVFDAVEGTADLLADEVTDGSAAAAIAPPPAGGKSNGNGAAHGRKAAGSMDASKNGGLNNGRASNGNGTNGGDAHPAPIVRPGAVHGGGDHDRGSHERGSLPAPRDWPDESPIVARTSGAPADAVAAAAELVARRQTDNRNEGLTLERIDVERRGGTLRCRTVLALGDRKYSAIAEVPDSPYAEAELAARVAVDAMRAGGLTTAMLGGVGFITIAKTNYCVATVREPGSAVPRASAAPMIDSMAAAATAAVLTALGSFTDARAQNRARASH
ncbi:MAG: hypothetical protein KFH98_15920 [Gemmatimonadetes bacterium]|nr:hypothetical protein [Gemmatimonadota bacterium]